jgi:organic hydroperoxide reductase OsmC/OhrA
MAEHRARIEWKRSLKDFSYEAYSRDHSWIFEGGANIPASAATKFLGSPERVDPEEAFVASLSSCHMLSLLAIASRRRYVVDTYEDDAIGYLEENGEGKLVMTHVILRPKVVFGGERTPGPEQVELMHHQAHDACFIANSVKTDVHCEPIGLA